MTLERSAFADTIWRQKYRAKGEETVQDTYKRVAKALSCDDIVFEEQLLQQLEDNKFIPAGRIFASAGIEGKYTLFNCFVSAKIEDSMEGIFNAVKEAAITQKYGGGIGFDFSTIRPSGASIDNSSAPASGPVSFMRVFDTMCSTVMSGNSRRGAMMAVLRCDHPDIIDFIHAKGRNEFIEKVEDPKVKAELYARFGALRNFNVSVAVTDEFMKAVENHTMWDLKFDGVVYNSLPARDLWEILMKATYETSEPGVIFIDTVNKTNNLYYCEEIACVNPCGEQPLPHSGNCNLGAVNLTKFVLDPFATSARIDFNALKNTIQCAVKALDNAIDVSKYPLPSQEEEGKSKRRIGLGIMGLGTLFQRMNISYGSTNSIHITDVLMRFIANEAYSFSSRIARSKRSFPLYAKEKFISNYFMYMLAEHVVDSIYNYGIRNSVLLTVAPTGTTALAFGDNCTSGLEPAFSLSYTRNVRVDGEDNYKSYDIEDYGTRLFRQLYPSSELPDCIVNSTVDKLSIGDHLAVQEAVQKYIDASVSKTINLPSDYSFEDFKKVYTLAYNRGCKGCTTYRPSDVRGSILEVKPEKKEYAPVIIKDSNSDKRPPVLDSKTYYIPSWPDDGCSRYVTIADKDGKPWEIFVSTKSPNANAETMALARIISALFRRSDDASFIADVLKEVHSPTGGSWLYGTYVTSLPAAYGLILETHIGKSDPFWEDKKKRNHVAVEVSVINNSDDAKVEVGKLCPACLNYTLVSRNGCTECTQCGYTKCG